MAAKDLKELVAEELENNKRKALKAEKAAERQRQKDERAQVKSEAALPKKIKRLNTIFEQVSDKKIAAALSGDQRITIKCWRPLDIVSEYEMMQTSGFLKLQKRLSSSFAKASYVAIHCAENHILTADVSDLLMGRAKIRDALVVSLEWDKDKFLEQTEKQKKLEIM
tara:strand:- start:145033 stop:145533 length:501 start_codon:yes stop_codon:yes gene_type:complete